MVRTALLVLLLLTCTACQRPPMAMPTMFVAGEVAPLADTPEAQRKNKHIVFYATDREYDLETKPAEMYSDQRSGELSLGQLAINLGDSDAWEALNAAALAKPEGERPQLKISSNHRYGTMPWQPAGDGSSAIPSPGSEHFINQLETAIKHSAGKEITIYIHGFKNSYKEAVLTTTELSLYSGGLGPFIAYCWPSLNNLFEYSHDRDSVRFTTAHARRFVEMLANEINAGRLSAKQINLIAHSSGAEVVGSVLRELGLMSHGLSPEERQDKWRIGHVLLVAPDISTDVARERILKEDLRGVFEQMVVYTSQRDTALRWASNVLYRATRIGSVREKKLTEADRRWLSTNSNITLVNIDSQPNSDPVMHSHHRHSGATVSDILLSLRSDLPPAERGLTRAEGDIIWRFADDYERSVTEAAIKVYGKLSQPTEAP